MTKGKATTFNQHVEDQLGAGDHTPRTRRRCPTALALMAAGTPSRAADAVRQVRADRNHEDEQFGRDG